MPLTTIERLQLLEQQLNTQQINQQAELIKTQTNIPQRVAIFLYKCILLYIVNALRCFILC